MKPVRYAGKEEKEEAKAGMRNIRCGEPSASETDGLSSSKGL